MKLIACCGIHGETYKITVFAASPYFCDIVDRKIRLLHKKISVEEVEEGVSIYECDGKYFLIRMERRVL